LKHSTNLQATQELLQAIKDCLPEIARLKNT